MGRRRSGRSCVGRDAAPQNPAADGQAALAQLGQMFQVKLARSDDCTALPPGKDDFAGIVFTNDVVTGDKPAAARVNKPAGARAVIGRLHPGECD